MDNDSEWLAELRDTATPITELLSEPMGHEKLKPMSLIWAFDTTLGTQSIVFGRESVEEVIQQGGEYGRKLAVGAISFDNDEEWDMVCGAVLAAKGMVNIGDETVYSDHEEADDE